MPWPAYGQRIFERLRAEHGFAGSYTIVKDYLRERHARAQEMFVPLAHPPGHAQVDFGEAVAVGGSRLARWGCCQASIPTKITPAIRALPFGRPRAPGRLRRTRPSDREGVRSGHLSGR